MGELGRGCQGRDKGKLEKDEGHGEETKGPVWELLGGPSGPVTGRPRGLLLRCLPCKMRATRRCPPRSGVQGHR